MWLFQLKMELKNFQSNSSVNSYINELYVWEKCSSPSELFLPCDLLSRPLPLHSPAMNHDSTSQTNHFSFKQYRSRERERERRSGITVIKLMLASCSSVWLFKIHCSLLPKNKAADRWYYDKWLYDKWTFCPCSTQWQRLSNLQMHQPHTL